MNDSERPIGGLTASLRFFINAHARVGSNIGWLVLEKFVRFALSFWVGVWIARYLGPLNYGVFSYGFAFTTLFTAFATLGLDNIVVRNLVLEPSSQNEILGTSFSLRLVAGLLAILFIIVGIQVIQPGDLSVVVTEILSLTLLFHAFEIVDFSLQASVRSKYGVIAKCGALVASTGLKVWLLVQGYGVIAFAWATVAESLLSGILLLGVAQKKVLPIAQWRISAVRAKELLGDSWPLIFSGMASMIYLRIDQVMLSMMVGNDELGVYSSAVKLTEVWFFLPMTIVPSLVPSIVAAKARSQLLFHQRLQRLYNLMVLLGYTVAIPATVFSREIVLWTFGVEYVHAAPMLAVLSWGGIFVNLGVARTSFLMTMNWTKLHLFNNLLGAFANIVMNLLLIPILGGIGASIATLVAYWIAAHGSCFVYRPLRRTGWMMNRALVFPKIW